MLLVLPGAGMRKGRVVAKTNYVIGIKKEASLRKLTCFGHQEVFRIASRPVLYRFVIPEQVRSRPEQGCAFASRSTAVQSIFSESGKGLQYPEGGALPGLMARLMAGRMHQRYDHFRIRKFAPVEEISMSDGGLPILEQDLFSHTKELEYDA
jgi:hypothetical protein